MTDSEKREGARCFYQKWVGRGEEDKDDRSYWHLQEKIAVPHTREFGFRC